MVVRIGVLSASIVLRWIARCYLNKLSSTDDINTLNERASDKQDDDHSMMAGHMRRITIDYEEDLLVAPISYYHSPIYIIVFIFSLARR